MTGLSPGVYVGLPMATYHADPAVGSSGVKLLLRNPFRYWYFSALNPTRPVKADTVATKFGTAYHTYMLEPERFSYQIKFGTNESTVPGTLGEGEWKRLQAMRAQLYSRPRRAALLQVGIAEVSVFYRDPETGIMCKVRYDWFAPEWMLDLKTTGSVDDSAIRYDIPEYGYDVSGAMYSIAARQLKKMIRDGYEMPAQFSQEFVASFLSHDAQLFAFMMQEKEEPYLVRCPVMTPGVAACGQDKYRKGLAIYARHQHIEGAWPDEYPDLENLEMEMLSDRINYF